MDEEVREEEIFFSVCYATGKESKWTLGEEKEMEPGVWHAYDDHGKLRAIYGDGMREVIRRINVS